MLRTVLIPVDGSELSERILQQLRRVLQVAEPEVILLRAIDPWRWNDTEQAARVVRVRDEMLRLWEDLAGRGIEAQCVLRAGDPAEVILKEAEQRGVSLIAMATHGRSGLSRLARGSVAEEVIRRASAPVLLANPEGLLSGRGIHRFDRILVPLDGSRRSARILAPAVELARCYDAELLLLQVHEVILRTDLAELGLPRGGGVFEVPREACAEDRAEALRAQGLRARAICLSDVSVSRAILSVVASEEADLVALTTHGRSGLNRVLFGSVAEAVLRRCPVPLLIQRVAGLEARELPERGLAHA